MKYEVYRANKKGGKYVKIKTTTSCSHIDKGNASGNAFFYKRCAYQMNNKVDEAFSIVEVEVATTPEKEIIQQPTPTYTVTFTDGDIVIGIPQIVEHGKAAIEPEVPTKDGYVFDGWDKAFIYVRCDLLVNSRWKEAANKPELSTLSEETERLLRMDYLEYSKSKGWTTLFGGSPITTDDIIVGQYYGTVNGCEIISMIAGTAEHAYSQADTQIEAAGYIIIHNNGKINFVHAGGTFMSVKEAYDRGYFSKENVYGAGCLIDASFKDRY